MKYLSIKTKVIILLSFSLILFSCSDDIEKDLKEVSWSESFKIEKK